MDIGTILSVLCCFGLGAIFVLIMFWIYGLSPIVHWVIKSTGQPAKAVVLEVKTAGWGWYAGGRYSETLIFQPVSVKLEVHPANGAPYIATDRFNASRRVYRDTLKPGAQLQVSVASFSPQWVASLPETIVEAPVQHARNIPGRLGTGEDESDDPKARLQKLKGLLSAGLITQTEYDQKKKEILDEM